MYNNSSEELKERVYEKKDIMDTNGRNIFVRRHKKRTCSAVKRRAGRKNTGADAAGLRKIRYCADDADEHRQQ